MRADVRLVFLNDLSTAPRAALESAVSQLTIGEDQRGFSMAPPLVLEKTKADPTRDMFVVLVDAPDGATPVGVGVLQPADAHTLMFRGFTIDPHWQGQGIGTAATALAQREAAARYPDATTLRLTVHVDNHPGRRAYLRCGFVLADELVPGRAGPEHVMTTPLAPAPPPATATE